MGLNGFRARLVALAVLVTTLAVAVLIVVSYWLLSHTTEADANTLAHSRAQAISANVTVRHGTVVVIESGNEALDSVAWVYADGHLIDGSVPVGVSDVLARLSTAQRLTNVTEDGFLLHAEPIPVAGHHVVAVVRVDLAPYETSEKDALRLSLFFGGLTVVLAGVMAFLVISRALRVVHDMADKAEQWGQHDPSRRFNLGDTRNEFGELGRTLDHLLDRVEHALAEERRLTDEIAHELRTPLTVLRGEAQLADLAGDHVDPQVILREVERLDTAISTILDSARQRLGSDSTCNVASVVATAIAGRNISLVSTEPTKTDVGPDVVSSLLAPLLDNAQRHARSRVWITVHGTDDGVIASIYDDGPGFASDEVERVFEAGTTSGSGHGLGLAVVRRIANATGVQVEAVAEGRGHVRVTFPTAELAS